MKKLGMTLLAVGVIMGAAGTVAAQGTGYPRQIGIEIARNEYNARGLGKKAAPASEARATKVGAAGMYSEDSAFADGFKNLFQNIKQQVATAIAEEAKIDFTNLSKGVSEQMKPFLKKNHPNFSSMVYFGQIDGSSKSSIAPYNYTAEGVRTYGFVVTEDGLDHFYMANEHFQSVSDTLSEKTKSSLTTYYVGSAAHMEDWTAKQYREQWNAFRSSLPKPFNKHAKALLEVRVPFTVIDSVKIISQADYPHIIHSQKVNKTEYTVQYNLKDGSSFGQEFLFTPTVEHWVSNAGQMYSETVEKI